MFRIQIYLLFITMICVLADLPPGTRRNTYLPPDPTKGYDYNPPPVPFPPSRQPPSQFPPSRPPTGFPVGPTRPTPPVPFPTGPSRPPTVPSRPPTVPSRPTQGYPSPGPRPTPGFPTRPPPTPQRPIGPTGYPAPGPRPTPNFPDYPGQPTGNNGNTIPSGHDDHHHEPGMPFDFNYAVKEDAFGNDFSHNAISDGDVTRGQYKVQLPDGRIQVTKYTADWKHGYSAQVTYEGTPRLDLQRPSGNFRGY